jgi:hypothetical protein
MGGLERLPGSHSSGLAVWLVHRPTAGASVFHRAVLNEKFSETRGTVVAARGHGGWVESVSEVLMRDRAADALRRFPAAAAAAGVAVLMATACNGSDAPDPTPTTSQATRRPRPPRPRLHGDQVETAGETPASPGGGGEVLGCRRRPRANPTKSVICLTGGSRPGRAQRQIALGTYAEGLVQTGAVVNDVRRPRRRQVLHGSCVDVSGRLRRQEVTRGQSGSSGSAVFSYTVVKVDQGFSGVTRLREAC